MEVTKRDGSREPLNLQKIHKVLGWACEGIHGVSISEIEIKSQLQFVDGLETRSIHDVLINTAATLISKEHPNYSTVASRLMTYQLRKDVYNKYEPSSLYSIVKENIERGVYDASILDIYTEEEMNELDAYIKHDRDLTFAYAGMRQVVDKYLVQDRTTKKIYETPQIAYMLVSAIMFQNYAKLYNPKTRLKYVKEFYDAISTFEISLPTPIIAGVRTRTRQYSSCTLIDVGDSLESIIASTSAIYRYTANRAGIGLNVSRIRGIGSAVKGGEIVHTGVIPYLKSFHGALKSCTQNGIRGGSATVHYQFWHPEVKDMLVLKNNKGTEDNRIRGLDYSIQLSGIFYKRAIANKNITLFDPHEHPELMESFGLPEFDELYIKAEQSCSKEYLKKNSVNAFEFLVEIARERTETGRIYIQNIDNANEHSSFLDKISMSNLCQEVTLPTKPLEHIDDTNGEIALCILMALNWGAIKLNRFAHVSELAVRALDELIDIQDYPVAAAAKSAINRRSLGIGIIGFADFLAKHKLRYSSPEAPALVDEWMEMMSYSLIDASANLAKDKGACGYNHLTKYSRGIMPIHTYSKSVDDIILREYSCDWDALAKKCMETGVRNSTLMALMPAESSAVVSNSTNGVEAPRSLVTTKVSKKGTIVQVVKYIERHGRDYQLTWDDDYSNEHYIKLMAVLQKYIDQGISINLYSNRAKYADGKISLKDVISDILNCYKYGHKQLYYQNTEDGSGEEVIDESKAGDDCASGACKI